MKCRRQRLNCSRDSVLTFRRLTQLWLSDILNKCWGSKLARLFGKNQTQIFFDSTVAYEPGNLDSNCDVISIE